jgi:hypothetical protein
MCFILMLLKDLMLHVLQWLHMYVSSVCSTCFIDVHSKCFSYFKRIFHVFYLDVAMTIQVCFNSILHMLQRSDGCCRREIC